LTIPPFGRHFRHSAIPPFRHSSIPSAIPSAISAIPQRHDKEGSGGATMKATAAQQGRQNRRRDNEGRGGATIKRAAAQR
jgi:hypothetical protein